MKKILPVLTTVMMAAGGLKAATAPAERPNILFFFTDDQAYNTLGIYGNKQVKTPNIDRLGQQGLVFDRHYNTTAICMASRANVMSGLYEYKTGCNFEHGAMGTKQWSTSYPMLLKAAGYQTGFAGKFGFSVSDRKNVDIRGTDGEYARPFCDAWFGGRVQTSYNTAKNKPLAQYAKRYPHSSRANAAATIDFMHRAVDEGKPFCMSVYYKAPHTPLDPDPFFDEVYKDTVWKRPSNFGKAAGAHYVPQSRAGRQASKFNDLDTDAEYQDYMRRYNQLIHGVDYSIGMIRAELEKLGIADNTVIIFSSDNGRYLGAHGFDGKVLPYEEGARAPMIIYDPRQPQRNLSRRSDALSGNVDITATILDVAGVTIPDCYDGRSLLPIVNGAAEDVRDTLPIIQVWGAEATRCLTVMTKEYKYVHWFYTDGKKNMAPADELFHVTKDVTEMTNLALNPEYAPILEQMKSHYADQLAAWKAESVDYNGYQEYGILFDPAVDWETKAALIPEKDAKIVWDNPGKGNKKSSKKKEK